MNEHTDIDLLRIAAEALIRRAEAAAERENGPDLTVLRDPPEMGRKRLAATALVAQVSDAQPDAEPLPGTLPDRHVSVLIGPWPVLIGDLGPDAGQAADALRRYLNQAAIAWSHLGHRGEDLLLLLVGPMGSEQDDDWQQVQRTIERDDRVCRKLVWLPPAEAESIGASLEKRVLTRTFLARPWAEAVTTEGGGDLAALTDDALIRLFVEAGLTEDQAKSWFATLSADDDADIAPRLMEALKDVPS